MATLDLDISHDAIVLKKKKKLSHIVLKNVNHCRLIAMYFTGVSIIMSNSCEQPIAVPLTLSSLHLKLLRKVSSSCPAQHLFSVAVVQSYCLPYCLGVF